MADSLALEVKAAVTWLFQETLDLSTVADASRLEYLAGLGDGVGAGQADKLWHDERTLAAGAAEELSLDALDQALFGGSIVVSLASVKTLLIVNTATASGDDLLVGGAAAEPWHGPLGGAADQVRVPADSCLLLVNRLGGWAVAPGTGSRLRIANTGTAPVTYRVAIAGTSS